MSEEIPKQLPEQFKNLFEGDTWGLPTDMNVIGPAREVFGERLKEAGWTDHEDFHAMYSCFSDMLANAIAHGNLGVKLGMDEGLWDKALAAQAEHPTDKTVAVVVRISPTDVSVTITDQGEGFNWRQATDPTDPGHLLESKGRGIVMAKANFDSVTFNEKGNEVTLTKHRQSSV